MIEDAGCEVCGGRATMRELNSLENGQPLQEIRYLCRACADNLQDELEERNRQETAIVARYGQWETNIRDYWTG